MTATMTVAPDNAKPAPKGAIALLKADHEAVSQMFTDYDKTRSRPNNKALVAEICAALGVHAQIEDDIFYQAVRTAWKDKLLVHGAMAEHAGMKNLIAQLEGVEPDVLTALFVH